MLTKEFVIPFDDDVEDRPALPKGRVAIVHYWLVNSRGGERVLDALCEMYPEADIFTHVYNPKKVSSTIRKHKVKTSFIQKLPFAVKHYQKYLPLMPLALEQMDLSEYDIVISSESGPAKGVIVRPDAVHISYTHSPMRYIWDQYHVYSRNAGFLKRVMMFLLGNGLRQWDVTSAARVDCFVANSQTVANRISKYWRRDSQVIFPPVDTERFSAEQKRQDFYLYVGEFVRYKRADLAVEACTKLGRRLIVVGGGEEEKHLRKIAGPTIEFVGKVPDSILTEYYEKCKALVFPAEEDFGIVPVEAMAAGASVIAYGRGGASETVVNGETGVFFAEQSVESLTEAIEHFEANQADYSAKQNFDRAQKFKKSIFKRRFGRVVNHLVEGKYTLNAVID